MKYERYNLKGNPFLEEGPDFKQIDRSEAKRKLKSNLTDAVASGTPHIYVVLGEYGTGKTFTLQNVLRAIENDKFFDKGTPNAVAVYFKVTPPKTPSAYGLYVYACVVESIGIRRFREWVKTIREQHGDLELPRALAGIDRSMVSALSRFGGRYENLAWDYLRGRKLSKAELGDIKVDRAIANDQDAARAFLELLRFLKVVGVAGLVVFVDEIEYILSPTSGGKVALVLTTFKELYDLTNEEKIAGASIAAPQFVFASTPSAWDDLIPSLITKATPPPANAALWERVQDRVTLPPFLPEDTANLIRDRLLERRINPDEESLAPFERDVVGMIHRLSQGIPRRIIRICGAALTEAAEHGAQHIDEAILQRAYENYPWAREGEVTPGPEA